MFYYIPHNWLSVDAVEHVNDAVVGLVVVETLALEHNDAVHHIVEIANRTIGLAGALVVYLPVFRAFEVFVEFLHQF